jgi:hypothetical protein
MYLKAVCRQNVGEVTVMKPDQNGKPLILLYIDDLIFISKISIAAKEIGLETRVITRIDLEDIEKLIGISKLIMVDLNADHKKPLEFIERITRLPTSRDIRIVSYVSHIHHDIIKQAEKFEGVTVLPRSQFVDQIHGILEGVKEA